MSSWRISLVPSPIAISGASAVETFDGELGREAVAAEDPHRLQRAVDRGLGCEHLGHRRIAAGPAVTIDPAGGGVGEQPGGRARGSPCRPASA